MRSLTMRSTLSGIAFLAIGFTASSVISQVKQTATSQRFPQFENAQVKVWKTIILPHQPLAMHHHDHGRALVALTSGTMNIVESSGATEVHHWEAGKAYWLPAMAPGAMHSDVNAGDKPIEVMVVELQKEN
jgi:quercetin dioxygenase-like cupin family protein